MTAPDSSWGWSAERYESGFSWGQFIKSGVIQIWTHLKYVHGNSCVQNNMPVILPHINDLMKGPDLPVPAIIISAEINILKKILKQFVRS